MVVPDEILPVVELRDVGVVGDGEEVWDEGIEERVRVHGDHNHRKTILYATTRNVFNFQFHPPFLTNLSLSQRPRPS